MGQQAIVCPRKDFRRGEREVVGTVNPGSDGVWISLNTPLVPGGKMKKSEKWKSDWIELKWKLEKITNVVCVWPSNHSMCVCLWWRECRDQWPPPTDTVPWNVCGKWLLIDIQSSPHVNSAMWEKEVIHVRKEEKNVVIHIMSRWWYINKLKQSIFIIYFFLKVLWIQNHVGFFLWFCPSRI